MSFAIHECMSKMLIPVCYIWNGIWESQLTHSVPRLYFLSAVMILHDTFKINGIQNPTSANRFGWVRSYASCRYIKRTLNQVTCPFLMLWMFGVFMETYSGISRFFVFFLKVRYKMFVFNSLRFQFFKTSMISNKRILFAILNALILIL